MSNYYIGEIRMFAGNFAPAGWSFCEGQLMDIPDNTALFNLIGTTYGGDGQNTFALPDLRGRVPIHMGTSAGTTATLGANGGQESVTLTTNQIASHNHALLATTTGAVAYPTNAAPAAASGGPGGLQTYAAAPSTTQLNTLSIQNTGGNQPHDNRQPYLCVSFIIALEGVYPSPS
jgi:microcystin-dependent protein